MPKFRICFVPWFSWQMQPHAHKKKYCSPLFSVAVCNAPATHCTDKGEGDACALWVTWKPQAYLTGLVQHTYWSPDSWPTFCATTTYPAFPRLTVKGATNPVICTSNWILSLSSKQKTTEFLFQAMKRQARELTWGISLPRIQEKSSDVQPLSPFSCTCHKEASSRTLW